MTSKEYLLQARYIDERIRTKMQQIDSLNSLSTSCTSVINDMPGSPNHGGSKMADAVIKIVDLQEQIKEDTKELVELKKEIMDVIKKINNPEFQVVLEKRYLCLMSWEQIAVDMNYSMQHVYRIHNAALKKVVVPERVRVNMME